MHTCNSYAAQLLLSTAAAAAITLLAAGRALLVLHYLYCASWICVFSSTLYTPCSYCTCLSGPIMRIGAAVLLDHGGTCMRASAAVVHSGETRASCGACRCDTSLTLFRCEVSGSLGKYA